MSIDGQKLIQPIHPIFALVAALAVTGVAATLPRGPVVREPWVRIDRGRGRS